MRKYSINIKQWRREIGLSRAQLAKLVKVTQMTIWNWENGKALPVIKHISILRKIASHPKYGHQQLSVEFFSEE